MAVITLDFDAPDLPTAVELTALTRTDTGASVTLPSPADFTDEGSGTWSIDFDEPATGLTYAYEATATWDDDTTSPFSGTVSGTGTAYEGRYTTANDVVMFVDRENYDVLTDADRDGVGDDQGVIAQAVDSGESDVDTFLGGPVESFTSDTAGASARKLLNSVAYKFATVEIAAKRGLTANEDNPYLEVRRLAEDALKRFAEEPFGVVFADQDDDVLPAQETEAPQAGCNPDPCSLYPCTPCPPYPWCN